MHILTSNLKKLLLHEVNARAIAFVSVGGQRNDQSFINWKLFKK